MSASPVCTITGSSSGGPTATTNGVNLIAAETGTITLASQSGVSTWSISVYSTDETTAAPTLTVNSVAKTATFTVPSSANGSATLFKSVVNGGLTNGVVDPTLTTTFGVFVLTSGGNRLVALNQTTEGNATYGWIAPINTAIKAGGSGSTVTVNNVRVPWKGAARAVATTNITLSGAQTIDGVACVNGDRVLCTGQTAGSANGLYVVAAGAWARAGDMAATADAIPGSTVTVSEGSIWANTKWTLNTQNPITLGSTVLIFAPERALTVVSLRSVQGTTGGQTLRLMAYATLGDGGGGQFYWDATSAETDNSGTIITPTGLATGRWKRQYTGAVDFRWFGATGNGVEVADAQTYGSTRLTSASAAFTTADAGKFIQVNTGTNAATGTVAVTNGSKAIVGTGTSFTSIALGQVVVIAGVAYAIDSHSDNTHANLTTVVSTGTTSGLTLYLWPSFVGTIAAYVSATEVTLSASVPTSFTGQTCIFGTDDTTAIQAAFDAFPSGAQFQGSDGYYLVSGVNNTAPNVFTGSGTCACGFKPVTNTQITMSSKCKFRQYAGGTSGFGSVFWVEAKDNVKFSGGVLLGDRLGHRNGGEWNFGIVQVGCTTGTIDKTICQDFYGDGFYVGSNLAGVKSDGIVHTAITATGCKRNGHSVIYASNVLVSDSAFNFNGAGYPGGGHHGVDVEPDNAQVARNIKYVNCTANDNTAIGFIAASDNSGGGVGIIDNVEFSKCTAERNGTDNFRALATVQATRVDVTFDGCISRYSGQMGYQLSQVSGTKILNCFCYSAGTYGALIYNGTDCIVDNLFMFGSSRTANQTYSAIALSEDNGSGNTKRNIIRSALVDQTNTNADGTANANVPKYALDTQIGATDVVGSQNVCTHANLKLTSGMLGATHGAGMAIVQSLNDLGNLGASDIATTGKFVGTLRTTGALAVNPPSPYVVSTVYKSTLMGGDIGVDAGQPAAGEGCSWATLINANQSGQQYNRYYDGANGRYSHNGGAGYLAVDTSTGAGAGDWNFYTSPSGSKDAVQTDTIRVSLLQLGGINIRNCVAPSTPSASGVIYVSSGALLYIGSSGTITTLAPA